MTPRTFADFFHTYRHDLDHEMAKLSITVTDFKRVEKNTLIGFVTIRIAEMRFTIRDVGIHEKGGERWAQLPGRPQVDRDGTAIRDQGKSVGRIYKEHGDGRWFWSVNTSPCLCPPPHNGLASTLEEAKQQFKQRYEEMKAQGVRPFSDR